MSTEQYFFHPAMCNTKLNWFDQSPYHFKYNFDNGVATTKAFETGLALQLAVLDPLKFVEEYFMLTSEDRRTVAGKQEAKKKLEENPGKTGLSRQDFEMITGMQKAIFNNPRAKRLLFANIQTPHFWTDYDSMIECKARPELHKKGKWMADIVTTTCAAQIPLLYDVLRYGYHRKAALNLDAANEPNLPYFIIAVEKQAPFAVNVIRLGKDFITKGRREYKSLLKQYSNCLLNNYWPGYEAREVDEKVIKARMKHLLSE